MRVYTNTKEQVSLIIESLLEMIKNPKKQVSECTYFYHEKERKTFSIFLYLFKLMVNDQSYLEDRYEEYLNKYEHKEFDVPNVTNIESQNELDLVLNIKQKLLTTEYHYSEKNNTIEFIDDTYIEVNWLLTFLTMLFANPTSGETKEINICYTIPEKETEKVVSFNDTEKFLSNFTYYNIVVKHTDTSKEMKENNILIVKNAAINYLKHLKQYKHGLENKETYMIFYNLLKNECKKEGFELKESKCNLLDIEEKQLNKLKEFINEDFLNYQLSKQVHLIENVVWQSSNDITLLEHTNASIDKLLDLITVLNSSPKKTYNKIKEENGINDIQITLILIVSQFLVTYQNNQEEIDYSLLNLSNIKPKYMNSICAKYEQDLKTKIKSLNIEIASTKSKLDIYKQERVDLDSKGYEPDKYQKELEFCVSNINRESIAIARLNSLLASLSKEYEDLKKKQKTKYRNVDLYNYNHSIISHICNSIIGCSYYLKTNNNSSLFNNIIIFEDYEKTDNSFYLEVSFKELLTISKQNLIKGIIEQNDLPRLA
ncbi:MAG: hypothetical protein II625_10195 [Bacilli bacterium]|nr:hypothetical protein [Bacilli bacterium]